MKKAILITVLVCLLVLAGCASQPAARPEPAKETAGTIQAIKNVNLITMENDTILENRTILVKDGVIADIGRPDSISLPEGCNVIDGGGKYLLPGIIDMHTHIVDTNDMKLFLCNGVTTIRNMAEFPDVAKYPKSIQGRLNFSDALSLRDRITRGELTGPQIIQAGHILDGNPPCHETLCTALDQGSDMDEIVKTEKEKGYDYIKVYWNLPAADYQAIIRASEKYGIKVIGHVPNSIKYEEAIRSMYTIEHLTGLYDGASVMPNLGSLIRQTKEAGAWHCPTLIELKNMLPIDNPNTIALQNRPENRYIKKDLVAFWNSELIRWGGLTRYAGEAIEYFKQLAGELHKGGVGIVAGTDCGIMPYVLPGFSIHEEMQLLTTCGISNFEALKAATINAAKCLNQDSRIGSISVGKEADMVLVEGNPLQDINNTKRVTGVMLNGKWISDTQIKEMFESIAN